MKKHEFLAINLPHNLYIQARDGYIHELKAMGMISKECNISGSLKFDTVIPICHPLSDLTKPITHKVKTFVPIVELGKIAFPFANHDKYRVMTGAFGVGVYFESYTDSKIEFAFQYYYDHSIQAFYVESNKRKSGYSAIKNVTGIILKLAEWHFNLMDKSEEFIDVNTLETNPYA